jgi:hypothetical protein
MSPPLDRTPRPWGHGRYRALDDGDIVATEVAQLWNTRRYKRALRSLEQGLDLLFEGFSRSETHVPRDNFADAIDDDRSGNCRSSESLHQHHITKNHTIVHLEIRHETLHNRRSLIIKRDPYDDQPLVAILLLQHNEAGPCMARTR